MSITIDLSQYQASADDSKNSNYPTGNKPLGTARIRWDVPTQYGDNSTLKYAGHCVIKWGLESGSLTNTIDTSTTGNIGGACAFIENVVANDTVYYTVQYFDAYNNAGTVSAETTVTSTTDTVDYTGATEITTATTITTPGTYKIGANITSTSGVLIDIQTSNVNIGNPDGYTITYADTGAGNAIKATSASLTNIVIEDLTLTQGAFTPSTAVDISAIRTSAAQGSGWKIRRNTITIPHGGEVSGVRAHGVDFTNQTSAVTFLIHDNVITLSGTSGQYGISIDGTTGSTYSGLIYDNTIDMQGIASSPAGYGRGVNIIGAGGNPGDVQVFNNSVDMDVNCDTATGISCYNADGVYINDNDLSGLGPANRMILIDTDCDDSYIIRNSAHSAQQYAIRVRYSAVNTRAAFNTFTTADGFAAYLGDDDSGGLSDNLWFSKNTYTATGSTNPPLRMQVNSRGFESVGDTFSGGNSSSVLFIGSNNTYNGHVNAVIADATMNGDIKLQASPTNETSVTNAVFAEQSGNINEVSGTSTYTTPASSTAYIPTGTPKAPTNLRSF